MLGEKLRELRKNSKMSQEELAEKLGVSRQSISLWENGQTQPTIENIVAIADVFGVTTDEIIKGTPVAEKTDSDTEEIIPDKKSVSKSKIIFALLIAVIIVIGIMAFSIHKGNDDAEVSTPEIISDTTPKENIKEEVTPEINEEPAEEVESKPQEEPTEEIAPKEKEEIKEENDSKEKEHRKEEIGSKDYKEKKEEFDLGMYDFYYKVDEGEYAGTVHHHSCSLLTETMKVHENAFPNVEMAFKKGYKSCSVCGCIK